MTVSAAPSQRDDAESRRRTPTLVVQILLFQTALLTVVLAVVAFVLVAQSRATFAETSQRRMLTVAEYAAALPSIRFMVESGDVFALTGALSEIQTQMDVDAIVITGADGITLAAPTDPEVVGRTFAGVGSTTGGVAVRGGAESGVITFEGRDVVAGEVPIVSDRGAVVGAVVAMRTQPSLAQTIGTALPDLMTYLGVTLVLGIAGSWWLASRVKRQTRGLEPDEIARLVEQREATLEGLFEGVISVTDRGRVTVANGSARRMLGLTGDPTGSHIDDLGLNQETVRSLTTPTPSDSAVVENGNLLIVNQTSIQPPRSRPELVTTLRDRTELVELENALADSRHSTDTLRAQAHEFTNRLHTISVLTQLGQNEKVVDFIESVTRTAEDVEARVLTAIEEPSVAALVLAKLSLASERGVTFTLAPRSALPALGTGPGATESASLVTDLVTIIGNLVDNAFEAVLASPTRTVELSIAHDPHLVSVAVADSGPGVDAKTSEQMFARGYSSKLGGPRRGYGLALVKVIVERRDGSIDVARAPSRSAQGVSRESTNSAEANSKTGVVGTLIRVELPFEAPSFERQASTVRTGTVPT